MLRSSVGPASRRLWLLPCRGRIGARLQRRRTTSWTTPTAWFGLPPHKLHLRLRLEMARELLRRGSAIAEAAYATGFHDPSHLTRVFTSAYGVTPAVYRTTFRGAAWTAGLRADVGGARTCNTAGGRRF
ncbi:AraC family transcriptional regulator [Streptomyces sp. NPDC046805]|uniref:AraC family transcriptional regulator n=1 Tax=Streptomyces sp. NPDC046805 TaxID=3155134 RepID=UPI0033F17022